MKQVTKNPFKDKALSTLLIRFSAPAVAGMFANALYNIISRIYVGQDVGAAGLAGITLLFPLGLIYMGFSAFIGVGSNALFSIRLGEHRPEEARRILGNGFVLLTLFSSVLTVLSYAFLDPILTLLGADAEVFPLARAYAVVVFPGYLLFGIGAGMNHFIRSSGRLAFYRLFGLRLRGQRKLFGDLPEHRLRLGQRVKDKRRCQYCRQQK